MTDDPRTDAKTGPTDERTDASEHPLQRAHKFFQKAGPVLRDVNEAIEGGALEQVRDTVFERANVLVQRVDNVVANARAIEGDVIERVTENPVADRPSGAGDQAAGSRSGPSTASAALADAVHATAAHAPAARWIAVGVVAAAATYGALKLQRRS